MAVQTKQDQLTLNGISDSKRSQQGIAVYESGKDYSCLSIVRFVLLPSWNV
ncbi:MAG: competence system putative prepilin ComGE [Streptococcus salivarius]